MNSLFRGALDRLDRGFLAPRAPAAAGKPRVAAPLALFIATLMSTTAAGALMSGAEPALSLRFLGAGLPFSSCLLFILFIHEMGHYLTARRWGIPVSLPYFIPFPSLVGTMGAVIRMRGVMPNRNALLDVGASGPLLGFAAALGVSWYGIQASTLAPVLPQGPSFFYFGDSLIFKLLVYAAHGAIPAGYDLFLNPVGFAGWMGFFITSLNLMPMGQLDGGHVLYALSPRVQYFAARIFFLALLPLIYFFKGYLFWALMGLFLGLRHPRVYDEGEPLTGARAFTACATVAVFVLTFVPVPVQFNG